MSCSVQERTNEARSYEVVIRGQSPHGELSLATTFAAAEDVSGVLDRLRELGLELVALEPVG